MEAIDESIGQEINQQANEINNAMYKKLEDIKGIINNKIENGIAAGTSMLSNLVEDTKKKLETSIKDGAGKLKDSINNQIDNLFNKNNSNGMQASKSAASTLFSWRYSDYLTLFTVIGMIANEENILLRVADVIDLNMQHHNKEYVAILTKETKVTSRFFGLIKYEDEVDVTKVNEKAFRLKNAYTYVTIQSVVEVKPLMMKLPFMDEITKSKTDNRQWYTVNYRGTLGY